MLSLAQIREQYPAYANKSDEELGDALHAKYYSSIPKGEFYNKIGLNKNINPISVNEEQSDYESKGISGIASDIGDKALTSVLNLPEALMNLPGEAVGAGKQLLANPKRAAQNVGAGFGELGHEALSAPGNLRDYLVKKGLWSKESPGLRLPESILPKEFNYPEATGVKGEEPGDALLRGIPKGIAMTPGTNLLFKGIEKIPLTAKIAAKPLKAAEQAIKERGIYDIPLKKEFFDQAKYLLPKTEEVKDMITGARLGDYKSIFALQSQLGKEAGSFAKSGSAAERLRAPEYSSLRKKILSATKSHLENTGHKDIAKMLTTGQNKYRQYKYLSKNVYPPLKTLAKTATGLGALYEIPSLLHKLLKG